MKTKRRLKNDYYKNESSCTLKLQFPKKLLYINNSSITLQQYFDDRRWATLGGF